MRYSLSGLGLIALAGKNDGHTTVALLNPGATPLRIELPWPGQAVLRRISPATLPHDADLPSAREDTLAPAAGRLTCDLAAHELTLIRSAP